MGSMGRQIESAPCAHRPPPPAGGRSITLLSSAVTMAFMLEASAKCSAALTRFQWSAQARPQQQLTAQSG